MRRSFSRETTVNYSHFSAPPVFLVRPSPMVKVSAVGNKASVRCVAAGNPAPTLFWTKEALGSAGILLPGENDGRGRVRVDEDGTLRFGEWPLSRWTRVDAVVMVGEEAASFAKLDMLSTSSLLPHGDRQGQRTSSSGTPQGQVFFCIKGRSIPSLSTFERSNRSLRGWK